MKYEATRTTTATPDQLWPVLTDVERWPEWIEVYESVRRSQTGPIALGDTARVKQKGLAAGDWTVSELDEGRMFAWEGKQPGVRLVGRHAVEPEGEGSRLTLTFEMSGPMAGLTGLFLARKVRAYVDLECERLTALAAQQA